MNLRFLTNQSFIRIGRKKLSLIVKLILLVNIVKKNGNRITLILALNIL